MFGSFGRAAAVLLGLLVATMSLADAAQPAVPAQAPPPPALNAIILLASPGQLDKAGWPTNPQTVDASRLPDLAGADLPQALHGLLGKPITAPLLGTVRETIAARLKAIHRPFAYVSIPRQPVVHGVLQVLVIEARLGKINVEGAEYFSADQYRDAIRIAPGGPIDTRALSAATDAINANQYRHAAIIASPGPTVGTTDLTIRAKDRLPLSFNLGIDNTGNSATGLYRINAGVDWGNAFWRGDDLNYQFSASPDFYRLRQYALAYTSQLPWGDTITVSGVLADSHTAPDGLVSNSGRTIDLSGRYGVTLPPIEALSEHLTFGYDFKSTNNDVLFGGTSVFPTTSEIDQFVAGIDVTAPDRFGSTRAGLLVFGSPGGLSSLNNDAAFASQQPGARAEYAYARLAVDRLTVLPAHLLWSAAVTAQVSSGVLLPSEQLSFGGMQSIRGFVEEATTRDEGVRLQNELRAPSIATGIGRLLHFGSLNDVLTPFVFIDAGVGGNHEDFAGLPASWIEVISTGPGVTWQLAPYVSARFTWGFPLLRRGAVGPLLGPQFAVTASF